jgi:N-methylhydantoinase A
MCTCDLRHDFTRTVFARLGEVSPEDLGRLYEELEEAARAELSREGVEGGGRVSVSRFAEIKYLAEAHVLEVPVPAGTLTAKEMEGVARAFHALHEQVHSFSVPEAPVIIETIRVQGKGQIEKPPLPAFPEGAADASHVLKGERAVYDAERKGFGAWRIYNRERLSAGHVVAGPAIIEEMTSTTVIPPGAVSVVDRFQTLRITIAGEGAAGRSAAGARPRGGRGQ